jgi:hypothetical protein
MRRKPAKAVTLQKKQFVARASYALEASRCRFLTAVNPGNQLYGAMAGDTFSAPGPVDYAPYPLAAKGT